MKISEIANLLSVSKKTIYRRVDSLSLSDKGHITHIGKEKHVDLEGVELIRVSIDNGLSVDVSKDNIAIDTVTKLEDHAIESYKILLQEQKQLYEKLLLEKVQLIGDIKKDKDEQIKHLKEQLKEKDKSLNQSMTLVKNNQILLLNSQDRALILEEKKGFWSKFKKSQSI